MFMYKFKHKYNILFYKGKKFFVCFKMKKHMFKQFLSFIYQLSCFSYICLIFSSFLIIIAFLRKNKKTMQTTDNQDFLQLFNLKCKEYDEMLLEFEDFKGLSQIKKILTEFY